MVKRGQTMVEMFQRGRRYRRRKYLMEKCLVGKT